MLERAGIDYADLAGNAHLEGPGLYVHVEGRKPEARDAPRPARPNKAWVKTVMALLVGPSWSVRHIAPWPARRTWRSAASPRASMT